MIVYDSELMSGCIWNEFRRMLSCLLNDARDDFVASSGCVCDGFLLLECLWDDFEVFFFVFTMISNASWHTMHLVQVQTVNELLDG